MAQEKEYFAFISYQRKDEEWADRLRNKLEHYRLPSSVRKQDASLPKEIRPIFRDALELAGGVLAKEIEIALQQSKYLIVICSPNSAKSPWVNKEIQTFIDLGREDHIIPFIIDGIPFSDNPDTECFPPALRSLKGEKELLGININELSRDAAAIKVVARMFGLKFDTLWQRHEREQRRKRWMIFGSMALLAIVALVVAGFFINMSRTISKQNTSLREAAERMQADSILQAQHLKRITEDSIALAQQNESIQRQFVLIEQQKEEISKQRDSVKDANYEIKVNLSRILAKEASKLVDEGDSYFARLIAIEALPPNLPYTEEAELALRKSLKYNNAILRGHLNNVNSVDMSPDGKLLASAGGSIAGIKDNSIRIWDVITGREIDILNVHSSYVNKVKFSHSGCILASASNDKTIKLFFLSSNGWKELPLSKNTHNDIVTSITFSPSDSFFASSSRDGVIKLWNMSNIDNIFVQKTIISPDEIRSIVFSSDGEVLASCGLKNNQMIRFWNPTTGVQQDSICLSKNRHQVESIDYSPDGKFFAIALLDVTQKDDLNYLSGKKDYIESIIQIRDARTHDLIRSIDNKGKPNDWYKDIVFSDDGDLLVSLLTNSVNIWNTRTWTLYKTLERKEVLMSSIACGINNIIAIGSSNGFVQLWDLNDRSVISKLYSPNEHYSIEDAVYTPTGDIAAILNDDVAIWNKNKNKWEYLKLGGGFSDEIKKFSISPNGTSIITITSKTIRLWERVSCKWIIKYEKQNDLKQNSLGNVNLHFSPDGKKIIVTNKKMVTILDADNLQVLHSINNYGDISCVSLSSDSKLFAVGSYNHNIKIYSISNGHLISSPLNEHKMPVTGIAFSPNNKTIVSVSSDNTLKLWDVKKNMCFFTMKVDNWDYPSDVKYSNDGKNLFIVVGNKTKVYNTSSMKLINVMDGICCSIHPKEEIILLDNGKWGNKKEYVSQQFLEIKEMVKETYKLKGLPITLKNQRKYFLE